MRNGFTLIWIIVSTCTKFSLNKRTLEKKIDFDSSKWMIVFSNLIFSDSDSNGSSLLVHVKRIFQLMFHSG